MKTNFNPLFDLDFLNQLIDEHQREIYARVTALTNDELPIEYIEGRITGGTINVDGNSALRRTCNISMIAKDLQEVNNFNWTFKQKFKLEIGLKNFINPNYPDTIWFKQGIFIITSCNMSQSTNNYNITINGKDKMCLLNGDLGGALPMSVDFGIEEYYDKTNDIVTYTSIPIKNIIREAVQNYGNELSANIIINDLDDAGLELLEYRNEEMPLYLFRNMNDEQVSQVTLDGDVEVKIVNGNVIALKDIPVYATPYNLLDQSLEQPTIVQYKEDPSTNYQIMRFVYGDQAGYRLTDLTYAGELIGNIGETIVSVLDKIKNMLGEFEYFYDIDGKFIFQKKKTYVSMPWTFAEEDKDNNVFSTIDDSKPLINLTDGKLVTSFASNPNLLNMRNDYVVWGKYKSISGAEIPIHMRYAIDDKPTYYKTIRAVKREVNGEVAFQESGYDFYELESNSYIGENGDNITEYFIKNPFTTETWDWRELIYQMALDYRKHNHDDDFLLNLADANPNHYPTGKTGYEPYYIDLEAFWRELYNPSPEEQYIPITATDAGDLEDSNLLYVEIPHSLLTQEERNQVLEYFADKENKTLKIPAESIYVAQTIQVTAAGETQPHDELTFYPFIGSQYCCLSPGVEYQYQEVGSSLFKPTMDQKVLNGKHLTTIYENNINFVESKYKKAIEDNVQLWIKREGYYKFNELDDVCKQIYKGGSLSNIGYTQYFYNWVITDNFGTLSEENETSYKISYYEQAPLGNYNSDYWNKDIKDNPDQLIFWFDFLEAQSSSLAQYSVKQSGLRTKSINDTNVKSIYYRDVPTTIFVTSLDNSMYERQSGYTYIQLPPSYDKLFNISSRGKSAKERIDELIYQHSYCTESVNISAVPIYHLSPNVRISVRDEKSNVNGEYLINKITIPLTYNGIMSLTATKVVSNIY